MAQIKAKMKDYDKSKANALKGRVTKDEGKTNAANAKPTAQEATRKAVAQKAGAAVAKSKEEPKKFGEGDKMTRKDKANVSAAQLKSTGLSLRAYMNAWNKTGKRPGAK